MFAPLDESARLFHETVKPMLTLPGTKKLAKYMDQYYGKRGLSSVIPLW